MATPAQQQQILQQYAAQNPDFAAAPPEVQRALVDAITAGNPQTVMAKLEALHQQYPQYLKDEGILKNPAFWIGIAGIGGAIAAPAIASALGGSSAAGGAAGGALPATTTVPATGALAAGGTGLSAGAAGGSAAAAGTGAAVAGQSIWKSLLLGGAIPAGASVAGAVIATKGQTDAAKIQAAERDKELAQAKEIYEQQRKDQGPYRQSGYASLNALNFGLGLPAVDVPQDTTNAPSYANGQPPPTGQPFSTASLNQLGQYAQSAQGTPWGGAAAQTQAKMQQVSNTTVQVKAPNGTVYTIPVTRLPEALQQGGVRV